MPAAADEFQQQVIVQSKAWVKQFIIGHGICPFAYREYERDSIRYAVIEQRKMAATLKAIIEQCVYLDQNPQVETTLCIFPNGYEGFYLYLDLLDLADELLIEQGYEGTYQLASFHPDYCFDGVAYDDPSNYSNRSPYPTIHIIREAELEKALENYDKPESIPERNIKYTREKGAAFFEQILQNCMNAKHKPEQE
ncbi:DUF1415 domain-containing protein [Pelagibaculum spongiae]|uniref:DUF1415 domain-containing protein n=1 Tax=Pelagibaculum spongiae TaxID=2080658 RepID=A0A2V1GS17_9GAMM|nr:DUF1415 domain-containing protein [Pelagibaculum spongiae]PVZ67791.1 DUF1415 domain-containing protein [Pelagibaculum spongiae]